MSQIEDAQKVYTHLVQNVIPTGRVTTYGELSEATGIRLGPQGAPLTMVLYELFRMCDEREIPPITAIVAQQKTSYDQGRHGSVGGGYLKAEAESKNFAKRFREPAFEAVVQRGKFRLDPELGADQFQSMVEAHQDAVWNYKLWPQTLRMV